MGDLIFVEVGAIMSGLTIHSVPPFAKEAFFVSHSMELPVEFNSNRVVAKIEFADQRSSGFLADWQTSLGEDKNPLRVDAVTFARLAIHRVTAHYDIQPYAANIWDFADHINVEKYTEVGCFVLLKCDWFPGSQVIGISHFRRTWANNIVLDYLATHPSIVRPPPGVSASRVRGVGRALLYFICKLATELKCGCLWGEATQLSNTFYESVFKIDPLTDLIHVPQEAIVAFINRCDNAWQENGSPATVRGSELDRINEVEVMHPPFVGSNTAVFDPPRQLANRFLKLPLQAQFEIARVLDLRKPEDDGQPKFEIFRRFFVRAAERGMLAELWNEIEKRHPEPQARQNPFSAGGGD